MFSGFKLPTFEEAFKSYLLNYFDPDKKLRGAVSTAEVEVKTENSLALRKVYFQNYAATVFYHHNMFGEMFIKTKIVDCVNNGRYVHHHESDHDFVHPANEGTADHTHVIKQPLDIITTKELQCILNNIHRHQREVKTCDKNTNECYNPFEKHSAGDLLSKKDHEKIISEYRKFLKQESKNLDSVKLHYEIDQVYKKVTELGTNGFTSFITAFVSTLLDHYVEKGLLSRGATPKAAALITSLIKSIFIFPSIPNSLLTTANHVAISNMLKEIGLNPQGVNLFMNNLNAVISVTSTPFSLIDMALNGAGAAMGQKLAFKVIGYFSPSQDLSSSQAQTPASTSKNVVEADRTVNIDAHKPDVSGPRKRR